MKVYKFSLVLLLGLIILSGCEYHVPTVWQPNKRGVPDPVVSSIEPSAAYAGVNQIKLIGKNFSPIPEENVVYFNTTKVPVVSADSSELRLLAPFVIGDSVTIKVVVSGAYLIGKYSPYKVVAVSTDYGKLGFVNSITVDAEENLYANIGNSVLKLAPSGEKTGYATLTFPKASCMRMGPGGYLYLQEYNSYVLYSVAPGGGSAEQFIRVSKKLKYFDFDKYGNIYAGGRKSGLFVIHPDTTATKTDEYKKESINSIRVFDGYVYVALDKKGIYRNQILADGTLGESEFVFDWEDAGEFSDATINDITFSENGDMYIATNHSDPILVVKSDGNTETLFKGALLSPVNNFVWGNAHYLYAAIGGKSAQVSRIIMDRGDPVNHVFVGGAPYYGRQ